MPIVNEDNVGSTLVDSPKSSLMKIVVPLMMKITFPIDISKEEKEEGDSISESNSLSLILGSIATKPNAMVVATSKAKDSIQIEIVLNPTE